MTHGRHSFEGETVALAGVPISPLAASPGEDWISLGDAVASVVMKAAVARLRRIGAAMADQFGGGEVSHRL